MQNNLFNNELNSIFKYVDEISTDDQLICTIQELLHEKCVQYIKLLSNEYSKPGYFNMMRSFTVHPYESVQIQAFFANFMSVSLCYELLYKSIKIKNFNRRAFLQIEPFFREDDEIESSCFRIVCDDIWVTYSFGEDGLLFMVDYDGVNQYSYSFVFGGIRDNNSTPINILNNGFNDAAKLIVSYPRFLICNPEELCECIKIKNVRFALPDEIIEKYKSNNNKIIASKEARLAERSQQMIEDDNMVKNTVHFEDEYRNIPQTHNPSLYVKRRHFISNKNKNTDV